MNKILLFALLIFPSSVFSIDKKNYTTQLTATAPKIDARLDDACWKTAAAATDFITHQPQFGKAPTYMTEVRIVYDDAAIYIGAKMYDPSPTLIGNSLTLRDEGMDQDFFIVGFDTYHDGQNAYRFRVSAANVQTDERMTRDNLDPSWDAVWESKTRLDADGWTVEIRVPYSAIRFPNTPTQQWGLQCARYIKRSGEFVTWSPVDPKISGVVSQWGNLTGIQNIEPPFRLSLSPYIAAYFDRTPVNYTPVQFNNSYSYSGGMDLKYGINESFTLDATLIPDFGQVQSDNAVLNLSPFETQYDEKRPFFTEGTDLFQKAGIFYSRRIGGTPDGFNMVPYLISDDEKIVSNPAQASLYNATKFSGRTNGGLGIGVLNAVQAPSYALAENNVSGDIRRIQTGVLTNYNVLVFNQTLKNSSGISIINTNVLRRGEQQPDANVSAVDFNFNDKKNYYSFYGTGIYSRVFNPLIDDSAAAGVNYTLGFSKISGKFRFDVFESAVSDYYNPNDLGINYFADSRNHFIGIKFIDNEAHGIIQNWDSYIGNNLSTNYNATLFYDFNINAGGNVTFKNFWSVGLEAQSKPVWYYDYYEPRVPGMKFRHAPWVFLNPNISTDYRKPLTVMAWFEFAESPQPADPLLGGGISAAWQINNRINISFNPHYTEDHNNWGFVAYDNASSKVIIGRRDTKTISNALSARLLFSPHMNLTLRARHYWSEVEYRQFYALRDDGDLDSSNFTGNYNINFNAWNVDVVYAWQFAPGSFLNLVWKVNLQNFDQVTTLSYLDNFNHTLKLPSGNSIALKMIYYLDYQSIKKIFS